MKVAFLIPSLDLKGPNIFTHNLIVGLLNCKCECEVFYFKDTINKLNFPVKCTKISLFRPIDFEGFDIVHSTMAHPDIYIAIYKKLIKAPVITSMHCFMEADLIQYRGAIKGRILCSIWRVALSLVHNIIVSSTPMKEYYQNYLFLKKKRHFEIIPYGIPQKEMSPIDIETDNLLLKLKNKYTLLFGCGSLIKRKGFFHLVDYLSKNENVAVIIIGEGECRCELEIQAEKLNVKDRLYILGFKKDSYKYYKYCDVFCLTSNSEGFGLAMLEALAQGIPLVCSKLPIYEEFISEDNVCYFNYGDLNSFSKAVTTAINYKDNYAHKSLALYNNTFSINSMAEKHIEYYISVIKKRID